MKDYTYFANVMKNMWEKTQDKNVNAQDLLKEFYSELPDLAGSRYCNNDVKPATIIAYTKILELLSGEEVKKSLEYVFDNYDDIIDDDVIKTVLKNHPEIAEYFFDKIYKTINDLYVKGDVNSIYQKLGLLIEFCKVNNQQKQKSFFKKLLSFQKDILDIVLNRYMEILYKFIPALRGEIFDFVISYYDLNNISGLGKLYNNLASFIKIDNSIAPKCLCLLEKYMDSSLLDIGSAKNVIEILKVIYNMDEYKERALEILNLLKKQNVAKNIDVSRGIARIIGDTDKLRSTFILGKRVKKTEDNVHGFVSVTEIPVNETCVLLLGGNGANTNRAANGYLTDIEDLLNIRGVKQDIGVYSIVYNFGDKDKDKDYAFHDDRARRVLMFQKGRRKIKISNAPTEEDLNPRYIDLLFKNVFLPRISKNGKKIDVNEAIKNIRNINIIAHCHGGYTFLKLEEKMQKTMADLGYNKEESLAVQKQLLCVGFAPYCPLGVSKSTFISFVTAKDTDTLYYNLFDNAGREIIKESKGLSWFPENRGNVFVASRISQNNTVEEHKFLVEGSDYFQYLSGDGQNLIRFESNAIINGLQSSLNHTSLPSVKELVAGEDKDLQTVFDKAEKQGQDLYNKILMKIKMNSKKREI